MKVQPSAFILEKRPLLEKLRDALCARFEYASVLAEDTTGRQYRVSRHSVGVGEGDSARGFVVRVLDKGRYAEHSFNELEPETIDGVCAAVEALLAADVLPAGAAASGYAPPAEEPLVFSGATEYKTDPSELGDEAILQALTDLRDKGLAMSEKLLDVQARFEWQTYTKLFLSRARDMIQSVMWSNGVLVMAAARGQEVKAHFQGFSCLGGAELLYEMDEETAECAAATLALLQSLPMVPGEYTCICAPDVTGMIVHEAFGHGVEMDMFVKDRAQAPQFMDQYVASPLVTMHDGGVDQTATYFFDDEGTLAHDTVIIDRGILKAGISDLQSATTLGTPPTGNGRRESFARKAYTRMTNTWFESGTDGLEEMVRSVDYGFLLEAASSGMEDPKNWGIQCMVDIAREIKDGEMTGRVFSPVVLTGYVPDLLKSITAMSGAAILSGTGFCGKGHKEWVKVSDGGPYIKARIRLGKGGRAMKQIISALRALGVRRYTVRQTDAQSLECFFIRKKLDLRRSTDTRTWTVTVYRPFERDGEKMLGDSTVTLRPGMSREEIDAALEAAWFAAGLVANPFYRLPTGIEDRMRPAKGGFAGKPLAESMRTMTEALFAADRAEDVFINSAEVFMRRTVTRIVTSQGANAGWEEYDVWGEYVCQCPAPQDVETYHQFNYREPEAQALTEAVAHALEQTKARAQATTPPRTGTYTLVLDREQMREFFSWYVDRADAGMIYQKYSTFRLGDRVQGENVTGDALTVWLRATEPYTDFGAPMISLPLLEKGVLKTIHGGPRFSYYLHTEPTGRYKAIAVPVGGAPMEKILDGPCLHVTAFSDFQMDPLSGHFGGEIRLGFLYENGTVTPVTGGSVNGSILDAQGRMVFSAERYRSADYDGPLAVRIEGVQVAGV